MMKKLIAGVVSAALIGCPTAAFAESAEPAAPAGNPIDVDVILSAEAQGMAVTGTVNAKADQDGDGMLSFRLDVPSGEETSSLALDDVARFVDDTVYLNAGAVSNFVQMLTGDTTMADYMAMAGIESGWVQVEFPTIVFNQEAVSQLMGLLNFQPPQPSEELMAAIQDVITPVSVEETEEEYVVTINKDTIVNVADKIDYILQNFGDEIKSMIPAMDPSVLFKLVDLRASFGPYLDAYAEGRASVTGEDPKEIVDSLFTTVDFLINMVSSQIPVNFDLSTIPDLSDLAAASLESYTIDGVIKVRKDMTALTSDVTATFEDQSVRIYVESKATGNGVTSNCTITSGEQELARADFNAEIGETSLKADLNVTSGGQPAFAASVNAGMTEAGFAADFAVSAEGAEIASGTFAGTSNEDGSISFTGKVNANGQEALNCTLNIRQAENGVSGDFAAALYGAEAVSGQFEIAQTETGISGNVVVTVNGETGRIDLDVSTADLSAALTLSTIAEGVTTEIAKLGARIGMNAPAEGLDITAPESFSTVYDVIRNVTAAYYLAQQAEEEAETEIETQIAG